MMSVTIIYTKRGHWNSWAVNAETCMDEMKALIAASKGKIKTAHLSDPGLVHDVKAIWRL